MCDVVFKALRVLLGSNDCRQHCKIGSFHLLTLKEKQHIRCLWVATPNRLFLPAFQVLCRSLFEIQWCKWIQHFTENETHIPEKIADINTIVCCLWGGFSFFVIKLFISPTDLSCDALKGVWSWGWELPAYTGSYNIALTSAAGKCYSAMQWN